jgi:hypothetical protein
MTPCMGGWCSRRDGCPHYTTRSKAQPSERLCVPGRDGVLREAPQYQERASLAELIAEASA